MEIINPLIPLEPNWKKLSESPRLTIHDVIKYKDKPWNWKLLSMHPNIELHDILMHDLPWDWHSVSSNPNLPMQYVMDNDRPWNWSIISERVHMKRVRKYKRPWDWGKLSWNPTVTAQDILDYRDEPWNWEVLSSHPCLTLKVLALDRPWDEVRLANNMAFPLGIALTFSCEIHERPLKEAIRYVDKAKLSSHPELTFDMVKADPQGWDWEALNIFLPVTPQQVGENRHFPWDMEIIYRPNFTLSEVKKYLPEVLEETLLSSPPDDSLAYEDLPYILKNPYVDVSIIEKWPDYPWDWSNQCIVFTSQNLKKYCHLPLNWRFIVRTIDPPIGEPRPTDWWYRLRWKLKSRPLDWHVTEMLRLSANYQSSDPIIAQIQKMPIEIQDLIFRFWCDVK